jgi:hypothetical protein
MNSLHLQEAICTSYLRLSHEPQPDGLLLLLVPKTALCEEHVVLRYKALSPRLRDLWRLLPPSPASRNSKCSLRNATRDSPRGLFIYRARRLYLSGLVHALLTLWASIHRNC